MSAREEILARIRTALSDVPSGERPEDVAVPRGYLRTHAEGDAIALFAERVADYQATVTRVPESGVPGAVLAALRSAGVADVVVAPGFPGDWLPTAAGITLSRDDPPLSDIALDKTGAALTGAAIGIALTGTVVLDAGPGQGRRALTLVPDVHVCVIRSGQIVPDVPDALALLDPARPLTFISGPSATSDIELHRVEGVHGPRTLHVIVAEAGTG